MNIAAPAATAWNALAPKRDALLARCEKYATFTIPQLCTPTGYDESHDELKTDWQAVGAQCVNNLANKLMLALFAPSRPFFRLDAPSALLKQLGLPAEELQGALSQAEKACVRRLDNLAVRPKLYEAVKLLIVTGNCLVILGKDDAPMRVLGLKRYAVKRSMVGKVIQIVIHERIKFDELEADVQAHLKALSPRYRLCDPLDPSTCPEVRYYKLIRWDGSRYHESVEVDDVTLGPQYESAYTPERMPYQVLTWDLADDNDYGTGLVEQFAGDFAALSALSEAQIKAAILASEFRWLVNPAGQTDAAALAESENGDALPGVEGDVVPLTTGIGQTVQHIDAIETKYVNRIGRGFLLGASVIRNAERVTAEEVRLQAQELETSLGGVYSRLAVDFQLPISYWLIRAEGVDIAGTKINPTVITGLDALSRNSDLEALKLCLQDLAIIGGMSPQTQFELNIGAIAAAIFAGRGVNAQAYLKSEEQKKAEMENEQMMRLQEQVSRPVAGAVMQPANV